MGAGRGVSISLDGVRDKNLMQLKKLNLALFPVRYNDKYYVDALASGEFTKLVLLLRASHDATVKPCLSDGLVMGNGLFAYARVSTNTPVYAFKDFAFRGFKLCASLPSSFYFSACALCLRLLLRITYVMSLFMISYYSDICVGAIACRLEKKEGGGQVRVYIMTLGVLAPYRGLGIGTKLLNHVLDLCSKQNISEVYLHVQTNNEDAINFYKKFGFEITETIQNYYTNITPPDCYVLTRYTASTTKK
ncbi:N-alpha-acetyltransferase 50 [Glycine soja]|uniref:N-alpha-acetyltransferase 50 n=1 Tax=Glycine soja TaxID=3848 RepID=A0A445GZG9_GLYSO|nr:N-alpha-acetyltransferase 50 [Glycine soja]